MAGSGMTNEYQSTCFRCGATVLAGTGVLTFGSGSQPYAWPQMRFLRNVPMVEHLHCHAHFKGTGQHYLWSDNRG